MGAMSAWALLFIPAALAGLALLLAGTAWLERSVLSPRSLVLHSLRSQRAGPEHVEVLVAQQYQRLLDRQEVKGTRSPVTEEAAPAAPAPVPQPAPDPAPD